MSEARKRAVQLEAEAEFLIAQARKVRIYRDSPRGMTPIPEQEQRQRELHRQVRERLYAASELRAVSGAGEGEQDG